jgi:hypothetical protein
MHKGSGVGCLVFVAATVVTLLVLVNIITQ